LLLLVGTAGFEPATP